AFNALRWGEDGRPRERSSRCCRHSGELCKLAVGERTAEWPEPPVVHAKLQLMLLPGERQIVYQIDLTLLIDLSFSLVVLPNTHDGDLHDAVRRCVPGWKQNGIGYGYRTT